MGVGGVGTNDTAVSDFVPAANLGIHVQTWDKMIGGRYRTCRQCHTRPRYGNKPVFGCIECGCSRQLDEYGDRVCFLIVARTALIGPLK